MVEKKKRTHKKPKKYNKTPSKKNTVKRKKRTNKKKQKGGIKREQITNVQTNIHVLLSFPSIIYLPTSYIFKKGNIDHYMNMLELSELKEIIEKNDKYKRSPSIHYIFNNKSYNFDEEGNVIFNYNNFSCDDIISKNQRGDGMKKLFLLLLDCNVSEKKELIDNQTNDNDFNESIYQINDNNDNINDDNNDNINDDNMMNNDDNMMNNDMINDDMMNDNNDMMNNDDNMNDDMMARQYGGSENKESEYRDKLLKEIENEEIFNKNIAKEEISPLIDRKPILPPTEPIIPKPPTEPIIPKPPTEPNIPKPPTEPIIPTPELIEIREPLSDLTPILPEENPKMEQEMVDNEMKKMDEMKNKLELERLENRRKEIIQKDAEINEKLQAFQRIHETKRIHLRSKGDMVFYNSDWFNICCGIEKIDEYYEDEINEIIKKKGIVMMTDEVVEDITKLLEDDNESIRIRRMIRSRLIDSSKIKDAGFYDRVFKGTPGILEEDKEPDTNVLIHLYPEYKTFLKRNVTIKKINLVLILLYIETRLEILSKYLSLEILRRDNKQNREKHVKKILDEIAKSDEYVISIKEKAIQDKTTVNRGVDVYNTKIADIKEKVTKSRKEKLSKKQKMELELNENREKQKETQQGIFEWMKESLFGEKEVQSENFKGELKEKLEQLTSEEKETLEKIKQSGGRESDGTITYSVEMDCNKVKDKITLDTLNNSGLEKCFSR